MKIDIMFKYIVLHVVFLANNRVTIEYGVLSAGEVAFP